MIRGKIKIIDKIGNQKYILRNNEKALTLVSLVITIILLLILARNCNKYVSRRKWINIKSKKISRKI